jgi:hypothetical protein
MKFNWGTGLFIFIALFMLACIAFFIYSFQVHNSLVESDYYPRGLKYEDRLKEMRNTSSLPEKVSVVTAGPQCVVHFPADTLHAAVTGSILVYRPSDENLDFTVPAQPDSSGNVVIPLDKMKKGKYRLKIEWTRTGTAYYQEEEFIVY